jgi:adenylate cyclase
MPIEIERKFLVRNDTWRDASASSSELRQGYLNLEQRCSIRVRTDGGRGWLNIKGATVGVQRLEYEFEIPVHEAEELLNNFAVAPLIEKTRHLVPHDGQLWEVDEFYGDNSGLVIAEIELDEVDQAVNLPEWVGQEVTHDVRYYNTSLTRHPFSRW